MKKILAILLAAIIMLMASAVTAYANEDEEDEADESEEGAGDSAGEEGAEGEEEETENSMPGFELAFAAALALAAARLARIRMH